MSTPNTDDTPRSETKPATIKPRFVVYASIALVVLIGGYSGLWLYAANEMHNYLRSQAEQVQADGVDLSWEKLELSGYPGSVKLTVHGLSVSYADVKTLTVRLAPMTIQTRPWPGAEIIVDASGEHLMTIKDGPKKHEFGLRLERLIQTVVMDKDGLPRRLDSDVRGAVIRGPDGKDFFGFDSLQSVSERVDSDGAADQPSIRMSSEINGTRLLADFLPISGVGLDQLKVDMVVLGRIPNGPIEPALRQWREQGGAFRLAELRARQGPLKMTASATLTLDHDLQPEGEATSRIEGMQAYVDTLKQAGGRDAQMAEFAQMMLLDLAKAFPDESDAIRFEFRLADRWLTLADDKVLRIEKIDWSQAPPDLRWFQQGDAVAQ